MYTWDGWAGIAPKHWQDELLAAQDIPSARGVGQFPDDMAHCHAWSEVPPKLLSIITELRDARKTAAWNMFGMREADPMSEDDRAKIANLWRGLGPLFWRALDAWLGGAGPMMTFHTYEIVDPPYVSGSEPGKALNPADPIRNIETRLADKTPRLLTPVENVECPDQVGLDFFVNRNGQIEVMPFITAYDLKSLQIEDALRGRLDNTAIK